jgi:small subunit ribosomal protein S9
MKRKLDDIVGVGRRKTAVAAVRLRKGKGNVDINGKEFEVYFVSELQRQLIMAPFEKTGTAKKHDLIIRVKGGGITAQGEACRLGLARALVKQDEDLRSQMKESGFLTRDPRKKERKKYGLAGARKKYQHSKR